MGIVEELGSGTVKIFKYTPLYANGKEPVIEEQDVYRTEIPYITTLQVAESESGLKKTSEKIIDILRTNPLVVNLGRPTVYTRRETFAHVVFPLLFF